MEPDQSLTRSEAQALLAYVELTYRSVTATRRRVAAAALAVAILFGLLCAVSTVQWATHRSRISAVPDEALIDVVGVRIPDPRPALERGQLRLQSLVWGLAAAVTGAVALLFLVVYGLARVPPVPELPLRGERSREPDGPDPHPPM